MHAKLKMIEKSQRENQKKEGNFFEIRKVDFWVLPHKFLVWSA